MAKTAKEMETLAQARRALHEAKHKQKENATRASKDRLIESLLKSDPVTVIMKQAEKTINARMGKG